MGIILTDLQKQIAHEAHRRRTDLQSWYSEFESKFPLPFYCSIDIRDAGYKIAPVDTNLYPAGFNNICSEDLKTAPEFFERMLSKDCPNKRVLLVPETHTQNLFYIDNLIALFHLIENAGFEVKVGWYEETEGLKPLQLTGKSSESIDVFPIQIRGDEVFVEDGISSDPIAVPKSGDPSGGQSSGRFIPDVLVLNNDFSGGFPEKLRSIRQPVRPSQKLGWHTRQKSEHFDYYNNLVCDFSKILGIDPWVMSVNTTKVGPINFNEDSGIELLEQTCSRMFDTLKSEYQKHHVSRDPFLFVKANSGTYGMGIMVIHSMEELKKMNRRTKNKMSVGKNRSVISSVVVQEGIPTQLQIDGFAAEPVVYMVGNQQIGGFIRTNTERGSEDNLNAQGMIFRKLCMSDLRCPDFEKSGPCEMDPNSEPVLELVYGTIGRLAAMATAQELAAHA